MVNVAFDDYKNQGISLTKYKLIYIAIYSVVLAIVVNKLMSIGLLPTSPADWIDLIEPYSVDIWLFSKRMLLLKETEMICYCMSIFVFLFVLLYLTH